MKSAISAICLLLSLMILFGFPFLANCEDSSPATVPVLSPEAAERANHDALKESSKKRVTGIIKEISHVISPETAAYDECNFTLLLSSENEDYIITVPMFINRCLTEFSDKKVNDFLVVEIIPFEMTSKRIQEIQTIDDINDFEHTMFYSDAIKNDSQKKEMYIDQKKKAEWLNQLLEEVEQEINNYQSNLSDREELDKEIDEQRSLGFQAKQKTY